MFQFNCWNGKSVIIIASIYLSTVDSKHPAILRYYLCRIRFRSSNKSSALLSLHSSINLPITQQWIKTYEFSTSPWNVALVHYKYFHVPKQHIFIYSELSILLSTDIEYWRSKCIYLVVDYSPKTWVVDSELTSRFLASGTSSFRFAK